MVFIETLSVRACCMNVLTVISPGLKVLFERVGKPEVINRPDFSRLGGNGAVIACNHVGWADSLWVAYAVYPRQLRYMSKQELFSASLSRWVLEHVGSIPIDRADPSPSSIKAAVEILQHGGVILIFPSGTRSDEDIAFKRGAATVALHARVPLVPAFFQGEDRHAMLERTSTDKVTKRARDITAVELESPAPEIAAVETITPKIRQA